MAVNLKAAENLLPIPGIRTSAVSAGIKKTDVKDMVLIEAVEGTTAAAVFTRNAFCAAPVILAREHVATQQGVRALLINSGNANAGTGSEGLRNARQSCAWVAEQLGCAPEQVLPFSTGVISQQLPIEKFEPGIQALASALDADAWIAAAEGIMTTDTVSKGLSVQVDIDGVPVTLTGIAKGSGMIRPDMATMLGYIATDAKVDQQSLQQALNDVVAYTFNSVTVDGDTSTNDACVLLATGVAEHQPLNSEHKDWPAFVDGLQKIALHLAQALVRDGEGATKFIEIDVKGGKTVEECREVAFTVAHSPLVMTAFFASDPNLGRILAAVGRAPVEALVIEQVSVALNDVGIVKNGEPDPTYTEEAGQVEMNKTEITIHIDLGRGDADWRIWTSDLSHEYVRINAEYRS